MATWARRPRLDRSLRPALRRASKRRRDIFMGEAKIQRALYKAARLLDEDGIPYALIGAMALNAYGLRTGHVDIDSCLTAEGLEEFKGKTSGSRYVQKFPGRKVCETPIHVTIDVVLAGEYPGDGLPQAGVFPDPAQVAWRRARGPAASPPLIELKLASG